MARRKEEILTCDVCKRSVSDSGGVCRRAWELHIGGHPFSGWFHVIEHGGSTQLAELKRKKDWDICSRKCLEDFAKNPVSNADLG